MLSRCFSTYHPIVQLVYFTAVITFTMLIEHPVFLSISLLCAFVSAVISGGKKALKASLFLLVPSAVLFCLINPLFSHQGITILFYLPDGNPFTLESVIYGLSASCILSSVMLWCVCLRYTVSSDRVLYLFGRISPKLSLLLSMTLRFVPLLISQLKQVRSAHRCLGRDTGSGGIIKRTRAAAGIISCVTGRALEGAVITADSMKSRGYGLSGRTAYSLYHIRLRDITVLAVLISLSALITAGMFSGITEFYYYPYVMSVSFTLMETILYIGFMLLCTLPVISGIGEEIKWSYARSRV